MNAPLTPYPIVGRLWAGSDRVVVADAAPYSLSDGCRSVLSRATISLVSDLRLSRVQQNEIAAIAKEHGLALGEFEWCSEKNFHSSLISRLTHPPTGAYLTFDIATDSYFLSWWPRFGNVKAENFGAVPDWRSALALTSAWLKAVGDEQHAPDLWGAARQERKWLTEAPSLAANTPFTQGEREVIAARLRVLEQYAVATYQLSEAQHAEVREQLANLEAATVRLGRFDWRGLAIATVISIVLQLGLTPERSNDFLRRASELLGTLAAGAAGLLGK